MRIPEPDSSVRQAIVSAVDWLDKVKIEGYRFQKVPIAERPYHETTIDFDRELVADPSAPPVWARYYDLNNGEPFLSLRDGTIVYYLSDISFDRRIGYAWYGYWPDEVFVQYRNWEKRTK